MEKAKARKNRLRNVVLNDLIGLVDFTQVEFEDKESELSVELLMLNGQCLMFNDEGW